MQLQFTSTKNWILEQNHTTGTKTVLVKFAGLEKKIGMWSHRLATDPREDNQGLKPIPLAKKRGKLPPSHLTSVGGNNMPVSALLATKEKFVNQKKIQMAAQEKH